MAEAAGVRAGDWEASGAATGSFVVSAVRERGVYTTAMQGEDLVLSLKDRCQTSSGIVKAPDTVSPQFGFSISQAGAVDRSAVVIVPKFTAVVDGTTVTFPGGKAGVLRLVGTLGADSGRLTFSFGGRGAGGCTISPTTFQVRRGSRLGIKDGEWQGRAANGQPVLFGVEDGGRAIIAPLPTPATLKNPAEFFDRLLSFEFGQGCVNYDGGASCPTTTPSSSYGSPTAQPCLHVSSSPALIGLDRAAMLALQDSGGTQPTGQIDASVKLHFTSRTAATGAYTQLGDPACSSRFTATAP